MLKTEWGSSELVRPPEESTFELDLQLLPKTGDVLHIHTDYLPAYFTRGGTEPHDVIVNRDESAGEFKDTVKFTVARQPGQEKDSVIHIVRLTGQVATVLYWVDTYPKHHWRDFKQ